MPWTAASCRRANYFQGVPIVSPIIDEGLEILVSAKDGFMPSKAHGSDVGFDCRACIEKPMAIFPNGHAVIPLGFSIATPAGYVSDVRPRSGLTSKGIVTMYGTVDPGYRGQVKACLFNIGYETFVVHPNDRIAQLVIVPVPSVSLVGVDRLDDDTDRHSDGFGSTGLQ